MNSKVLLSFTLSFNLLKFFFSFFLDDVVVIAVVSFLWSDVFIQYTNMLMIQLIKKKILVYLDITIKCI